MTSNILKLVDGVAIDGGSPVVLSTHPRPTKWQIDNSITDLWLPQRVTDESGHWQIELNQDPDGGAVAGSIDLEGRLSPDAGFVTVDSVDLSTISGLGSPWSIVRANVDLMPQMRIRLVGPANVAASTTAEVWVME